MADLTRFASAIERIRMMLADESVVGKTKDQPVVSITRQHMETIMSLYGDDLNAKVLVDFQSALLHEHIAFISLPQLIQDAAGPRTEVCYYVAPMSHPFLLHAQRIKTSDLNRIVKTSNVTLPSILAFTDLGFTESMLPKVTCEAIGHSRIITGADGSNKSGTCIRCGRTVKKSVLELSKPNGTPAALKRMSLSAIVSWKDFVHVPASKLQAITNALVGNPNPFTYDNDESQSFVTSILPEPVLKDKRNLKDKSKPAKEKAKKAEKGEQRKREKPQDKKVVKPQDKKSKSSPDKKSQAKKTSDSSARNSKKTSK